MTGIDINGVFERICEAKGLKSDSALADFLGVSKSAINQSRTKGTANLWTLIERCAGLDLNWLLLGRQGQPEGVEAALRTLASAGFRVTLEPIPGHPTPPPSAG